ncbi:MAG: heat shock protein HspQ [Nitratireductor sp.]
MPALENSSTAKYGIGHLVKHRVFGFRGVVFDVDPEFSNTQEWYDAIPEEVRPKKDQPFYHVYAENDESEYVAYVSEQNLLEDENRAPVRHPQVDQTFERAEDGNYKSKTALQH